MPIVALAIKRQIPVVLMMITFAFQILDLEAGITIKANLQRKKRKVRADL